MWKLYCRGSTCGPLRDLYEVTVKEMKLSLCTPWRHIGNGGVAPLILNLDIRWRWVVRFTPQSLGPPERDLAVSVDNKAAWALKPVWTHRREENLLSLSGIELRSFGCRTHGLFTTPTELSRLLDSYEKELRTAAAGFHKRKNLLSSWASICVQLRLCKE